MASLVFDRAWWAGLFLRGVAVGLLGVALWSLVGVLGAIVLVSAVTTVWILGSTVYAFAVGQLLFGTLFVSRVEAPLVVAAVFGMLFVAEAVVRWPRSTALFTIVTVLLAWGGLASARLVDPLWAGAAAMLTAFGLFAYAIHRYELVTLGKVEGAGE
jgi:hypothetical protein